MRTGERRELAFAHPFGLVFDMENAAFQRMNETEGSSASPAVGKAVRLLRAVSRGPESAGISELARQTGLSKSTVHGLVAALVAEELLEPLPNGAGYGLGAGLLEFGEQARDQRFLGLATVTLDRLAGALRETILLGRVDGTRVTVLSTRLGAGVLNLSAPQGSSIPATAGAVGQVLLALLPDVEVEARGPDFRLPARQDHERYIDSVREARQRGYAMERDEYLAGVAAIATALAWRGRTYVLWVVGLSAAFDAMRMQSMANTLVTAVADLRRDLSENAGTAVRTAR